MGDDDNFSTLLTYNNDNEYYSRSRVAASPQESVADVEFFTETRETLKEKQKRIHFYLSHVLNVQQFLSCCTIDSGLKKRKRKETQTEGTRGRSVLFSETEIKLGDYSALK